MSRGNWQPARLTVVDMWTIITVLVVQSLIRGGDYATGHDKTMAVAFIERVWPLWTWSVLCLGGGALLAAGVLLRRHVLVWGGHLVLWITYSVLFMGFAVTYLARPNLDGIRSASVLLIVAVLHGILMLRTGPRPLKASRSEFSETIVHPTEG